MRVSVFRNLTKKCYSVKRGNKVVQHTDNVVIQMAEFVVQPAGRERVRREHKKYVHAFVRGDHAGILALDHSSRSQHWVEVSYNPYNNETFINKATGEPVLRAEMVWLNSTGCWAYNVNPSWWM